MPQKTKKKNMLIIIFAIATLLVALLAVVFIWNNLSSSSIAAHKPSFVFDKATAPGWWGGVNNWPEEKDFEGGYRGTGELPVASMVIYQGTEAQPGNCFVMSFYKKGTVDIKQALKERRDAMTRDDGDSPSLELIDTTPQTMQTPEGMKQYSFYQYNFTLPGQAVQKGNAFGFVNLSEGHIEIRGICSTADEFPTIQAGLAAIRLDA